MKEKYIVAQNAFTISVDDGLPAWIPLRSRFSPFIGYSTEKSVLEIVIRELSLPDYVGEIIYEPAHTGISFISARASRLPDTSLVMEFLHIADKKPRVWMKMPAELDRAEINIASGGDDEDAYFLTHALMIAFMLASSRTGTLLIHASSVISGGKAYLFQGKSGTGKSTHASLWTKNIADADLLNDDNPVIRFRPDGSAIAYGSPWSGKTSCYRNVSAPIGAFVRIVQAKENVLHRLSPLKAYASLTASVFFLPFVNEDLVEVRHKTIERLASNVMCCEMHCRPDDNAVFICRRGLSLYSQNYNQSK